MQPVALKPFMRPSPVTSHGFIWATDLSPGRVGKTLDKVTVTWLPTAIGSHGGCMEKKPSNFHVAHWVMVWFGNQVTNTFDSATMIR